MTKAMRILVIALLLPLSACLFTSCTHEQRNQQASQQKTQAAVHKAATYLRRHRADVQHTGARALRYTRLKVQRAKCHIHPKDKRYCKNMPAPKPKKAQPNGHNHPKDRTGYPDRDDGRRMP